MRQTLGVNLPDVAYARSGEVAIAYQVVGSGPVDIAFIRAITGDLLSSWDQPLLVRHVEGLATSARVLMLDKRGTGLSDRVREVQSLETSMPSRSRRLLWRPRQDSSPRHSAWEADTLPAELLPLGRPGL
jgi:hypothetical protein